MTSMLHHFPPSATEALTIEHPVTHEAIADRAREIWVEQGCPKNCDKAIWLEAEAELIAIHEGRYRHPHLQLNQEGSQ